MTHPVLLGGYAAKRCPVRVHNDYAPLVPSRKWDPSAEDKARLDAGNAFEVVVFAQLRALNSDGAESPRRVRMRHRPICISARVAPPARDR